MKKEIELAPLYLGETQAVTSADAGLGAASTPVIAGQPPDRCVDIEVQGSKK